MRRIALFLALGFHAALTHAAPVEPQPFFSALRQILDATDYLGAPFSAEEKGVLEKCITANDAPSVEKGAGAILDAHCLVPCGHQS